MKTLYESLLDIDDQIDNLDPIDLIFAAKSEPEFLESQRLYLDTLKSEEISDWDEIKNGELIILELVFNGSVYGMSIFKKSPTERTRTMTIQFISIPKMNVYKVDNSYINKPQPKGFKTTKTVYYITKKEFDKFKKHINK